MFLKIFKFNNEDVVKNNINIIIPSCILDIHNSYL